MGLKDKINQIIEYLRERRSKPLPTPLGEYGTGESLADFIASHGGVDVSDKYPVEGGKSNTALSEAMKQVSEGNLTGKTPAVDTDARQAINAIIAYLQEEHDVPETIGDGDEDDQIKDITDRLEALERRFYPQEEELKPILLPRLGGFWAKITGSTPADSPPQNRWKYAWVEVVKSSAGYGGWATKTDGRSGTITDNPAYNTVEDVNTGVGGHTEGNGVDPAHLDTADYTFEVKPCTTGNIVWMREVKVGDTTEYWFTYENGVDGSCD